MRKPNNRLRLRHILDAIERIDRYLTGVNRDGFDSNEVLQDAVVRQLEVIGEAATHLTPELIDATPHVPWQEARRARNRLIHEYFDVDPELIWDIAMNDLPVLSRQVEEILKDLI